MVRLDIGKTAFAGFEVIGRRPLAVLAWMVFVAVVGLLPALGLLGGVMSSVVRIIEAARDGGEPTPEMILPLVGSALVMLPVLMITGLLMRMMLTGAVFRAVLFPAESGWAYLRLGRRELWLGLLFIVVGVVSAALAMVMMSIVMPVMFLGGAHEDPMMRIMMMRAAMLPVYAVMAFLFVRFCLAFPMTFAESKFRLVESWKMTQGNSWRIVLVGLILIALAIALEIILGILALVCVIAVVGAGAMTGDWSEERFVAFFSQDPAIWMHALLPWIAGGAVVASIFTTLVAVVFTAPWAEAYRQLREPADAAA